MDAELHLKQCCRHLSSVDMVLHSSLEIVFSDCSNSSMEFYPFLCASGIQLDLLQKNNRLVGAPSECRDALKAILATSFFCGSGLAIMILNFLLWNHSQHYCTEF